MLLESKIVSAVLLAVFRLLAGLLPLKVYRMLEKWSRRDDDPDAANNRRARIDLFLSVFLCFGAGLLLSTCFMHMIPEVKNSFVHAAAVGQWSFLEQYPFAEGMICAGFFAVYLLEELGGLLMQRQDKSSNNRPAKHASQTLMDHKDETSKKAMNHGHSHGPMLSAESHSVTAAIRGFLLVAALSFHCIFEGMAIGLQPAASSVWFLFTAVLIHEVAIMFCIGMEMLASNIRVLIYVVYMVELGLVSSVGIAVGITVTEYVTDPSATHLLVIAILEGLAAGTLLYVTFLEVLERERTKEGNGFIKLAAIVIGFVLLSVMEVLSGQGDITDNSIGPDSANQTAIETHATVVDSFILPDS